MMKFCKDCRHRLDPTNPDSGMVYSLCGMVEIIPHGVEYMITGERPQIYQFCQIVRTQKDLCGPEAKLFEPITEKVS